MFALVIVVVGRPLQDADRPADPLRRRAPAAADTVGHLRLRDPLRGRRPLGHARRARRRIPLDRLRRQLHENMTSGPWLIALAAVIFGKWRPGSALRGVPPFRLRVRALAIPLQREADISANLISTLPYVLTLIALVGLHRTLDGPGRRRPALHQAVSRNPQAVWAFLHGPRGARRARGRARGRALLRRRRPLPRRSPPSRSASCWRSSRSEWPAARGSSTTARSGASAAAASPPQPASWAALRSCSRSLAALALGVFARAHAGFAVGRHVPGATIRGSPCSRSATACVKPGCARVSSSPG